MRIRRLIRPAVCVALVLTAITPPMRGAQIDSTKPAAISAGPGAQTPENPQQAYHLPPDKLAKAIAISRIRDILSITGSVWAIVFLSLMLATRAWAGLERWAERFSARRWIQGAIFFGAYLVIASMAGLPLDWIGEHYERNYGISVQGWFGWFGDMGKALGLTLLIGVPVLLLFHWIVRRAPKRYWLVGWLVTLPILAFLTFIEPLVVPLFYMQEPLTTNHDALVAQLEKVVARTGIDIPPDRMYLLKASAKFTGMNAFVAGMGPTKRYVMWDTTTDQLPDDEILFIFGHESGHYVLHHIPKGFALSAVGLFFVFWACAGFAAWMLRKFGSRWGATDFNSRTGFVVLLFAVSIAGFLLQPVSNAVSRHFEHQADVYGQEAIHGIVPNPQQTAVAAFNDLGRSWLDDPNPNPFIEFWLYDHPSEQHRAEFAAHYDPWANGGHGEFFKY
ncbi:MAG TPA: M48 family metallopeptidase [Terracidiphilus sp.]|nr:M48 family metallopeptidase [Terracidiphilus sp.]